MLLNDEVAAFINKHFVPVITDHPQGNREPKRNPKMWTRSEKWKDSPSNAQLIWLVTADESKRDGIYYNKYGTPEEMLSWMKSIVAKDADD